MNELILSDMVSLSSLLRASNEAPSRAARVEKDPSFHRHVGEQKPSGNDGRAAADPAGPAVLDRPQTAGSFPGAMDKQSLANAEPGSSLWKQASGWPAVFRLSVLPESIAGRGASLYPQSLQVIGYLSMLGQRPAGLPLTPPTGESTDVQAAMDHRIDAMIQASTIPQAIGPASVEATDLATPPPLQAQPDERNREAEGLAVAECAGAAVPGMAEVAKRMVRLSGDPQSATLWIRDYRMDVEQSLVMTQEACRQVRQDGSRVVRIVVNGREVWQARSEDTVNAQGTSHGG